MRSLTASLAAAALLVAVAPAAQARQYTHHDGAGDMHTLVDQEQAAPAPTQTPGDITRVHIGNGKRLVRLGLTLRDIAGAADTIITYFNLQNGRHQIRHVAIAITSDSVSAPTVTNGAYKNVRCRGPRHSSVSAATRILTVTVPRSCFNNPKVLRLNANTETRNTSDIHTSYVDDALTTGYPSSPYNFQSPVVWTPWVKRG